ncbi:Glycosyltransferases involved in cell wall biogenesis [Isoptericola variabilis J7]|nr:Glycosyltransferases involved in cell wall biogenesis [Isoptericola variabilis J7]
MQPIEDTRVTVVVASRDRRDELVASLGRHRAPVVLVDNGSSDGTPQAVRDAHPHVDVVEAGRNLAAAGRTLGARRARTPFVAFADDDSWWAPAARTAGPGLHGLRGDGAPRRVPGVGRVRRRRAVPGRGGASRVGPRRGRLRPRARARRRRAPPPVAAAPRRGGTTTRGRPVAHAERGAAPAVARRRPAARRGPARRRAGAPRRARGRRRARSTTRRRPRPRRPRGCGRGRRPTCCPRCGGAAPCPSRSWPTSRCSRASRCRGRPTPPGCRRRASDPPPTQHVVARRRTAAPPARTGEAP